MNFEITSVRENLKEGKVDNVQVHYKIISKDRLYGHNGFVTLDEREEDLEKVVKQKVIEQFNSLDAE